MRVARAQYAPTAVTTRISAENPTIVAMPIRSSSAESSVCDAPTTMRHAAAIARTRRRRSRAAAAGSRWASRRSSRSSRSVSAGQRAAGVDREAAAQQGEQRGRGPGPRRGLLDQAGAGAGAELGEAVAAQRTDPVDRLVEGGAQAELVGALVDVGGEQLLRGHVGRGPDDLVVAGLERVAGHQGRQQLAVDRAAGAGEAEVADAGAAVAVDEHVLGLEVAVDDAGEVGSDEAAAGLDVPGDDVVDVAAADALPGREVDAVDELHGDVVVALEAADLEHLDDVGVGHAGDRLGLAADAGVGVADHLDRDLAVELVVVGGVDGGHRPAAGLGEQRVAAEPGAQRREVDLRRRLRLASDGLLHRIAGPQVRDPGRSN
jgi:hypothetical protein